MQSTQPKTELDRVRKDLNRTGEPRLNLRGWIAVLGTIGCIFLIVMASVFIYTQREMISARTLLLHTYAVISQLDRIQTLMLDAETGQRGFIITASTRYLEPYNKAVVQLAPDLDELKRLLADDGSQMSDIAKLEPVIADKMAELHESIGLQVQHRSADLKKLISSDRGMKDMDQIEELLSNMRRRERELIVLRTETLQRTTATFHTILAVLIALTTCLVGLFLYLVNSYFSQTRRWYDLRQAEDLEEREREFRVLFDTMPQLAFTARPDGYVDFYNKGSYDFTGLTFEEMKGWGWEKIQDQPSLPAIKERWRFSLATGMPFENASRLRRADGTFRWYLTRINPIFDSKGKIIRWVGISTDIDEQTIELQSLNSRLKSSEQRLELALNASSMGVWELDWKTGELWRSAYFDEIFGHHEPLRAWTYKDLVEHVVAEDRLQVAEAIERAQTSGSFQIECRIQRADDGIRWIQFYGKSFRNEETGDVCMAGTVVDITGRKEQSLQSEYLAAVVEFSHDPIYSYDLEGKVQSWNKAAEELFGYTAREIIGKPISVIVPPGTLDDTLDIAMRVFYDQKIAAYETKRMSKQGTVLDVSLSVSPVKDENGKIVRACLIAREIGARKRADRELRETKEFLQLLFDSAPDALLVLDKDGIIETLNSNAEKLFGYTAEQLRGRSVENLLPDRFRSIHTDQLTQCIERTDMRRTDPDVSLFALRSDGSEFPVEIQLSPIETHHGTLVMSAVKDLTEKRRLEDERKQLETTLKAQDAVLKSPRIDPVLVKRAQAFARGFAWLCFAFSISVIIGCLLNIDFLRNPTPWGRLVPINAGICLLLTAVGIVFAGSRSKLGKYVVPACGFIVSTIALITAFEWLFHWNAGIDQLILPELHTRYTLIPGRMPTSAAVAFLSLGIGLLLISLKSPRAFQICGFLALCIGLITLTGHTYGFLSLLSFGSQTIIAFPMSLCFTFLGVAMLLVQPSTGISHVFVSPTIGGKLFRRLLPFCWLLPALGLSGGMGNSSISDLLILATTMTVFFPVLIWLVANAMDRLDRQKDQALDRAFARREELEASTRQLEEARDQALQASGLKSAFVANISHELRTPLTGIIGNIELLLGTTKLAEEQKENLETTLGCSQSLLQIVNDLLDISKIESGKVSLEVSSFDVAATVKGVVETMRVPAMQKGLEINVELDPDIPQTVVGDEGRIRQVLLNLVNNGVKFTHTGSVSIRLRKESDGAPNVYRLLFEVADTGIGLSESEQHLLFKPFSQVDSSATRKYGGTGLGLWLCKNLVDLMGGRIGVQSEKGKGSTFWFVVPVSETVRLGSSRKAPQPVQVVEAFKDKVVLVVEDNPVIQRLVVKQLSSLGITPVAVASGTAAIDMVRGGAFDCILMDCNLPDISGFEVTGEIRKAERATDGHVPIVAMTAAAMQGDRERCLSAGMDDYLSKPVALAELKQALQRWLKSSSQEKSREPGTL